MLARLRAGRGTAIVRGPGARGNRGILSRLLTLEQGKPITSAQREVRATADRIDGLAALEVRPEILREDAGGRVLLDYQPLGVVGAIAPWNAPLDSGNTDCRCRPSWQATPLL